MPFVVVRNCCLDCLLGQDRAMNFDGRQAVQGFHHSLVCKFERIIDGFTFDEFCRHRTSSNCGATSERFKCHICDDIVFYFNIHTHNAVSYTHLDVYKRQVYSDLNKSGSWIYRKGKIMFHMTFPYREVCDLEQYSICTKVPAKSII